VADGAQALLLWGGSYWRWSPAGYQRQEPGSLR